MNMDPISYETLTQRVSECLRTQSARERENALFTAIDHFRRTDETWTSEQVCAVLEAMVIAPLLMELPA